MLTLPLVLKLSAPTRAGIFAHFLLPEMGELSTFAAILPEHSWNQNVRLPFCQPDRGVHHAFQMR